MIWLAPYKILFLKYQLHTRYNLHIYIIHNFWISNTFKCFIYLALYLTICLAFMVSTHFLILLFLTAKQYCFMTPLSQTMREHGQLFQQNVFRNRENYVFL